MLALAALLGFVLFSSQAHAANLYWVGGAGDSLKGNANDWSTTNPGACADGAGDAGAVPGASDVAIFDADCDNGAILTSAWSVQGITLSAGYAGQISQGNDNDLTVGSSGYSQAGGLWVGSAAGDTDITTTSFTLTAGTFTAGDGDFSVSGDLAITSGGGVTFNHNNGTLVLNGSADQSVNFGAKTLKNLTLNNTGGGNSDDIVIANGSTVVVVGNVLITLGNLDLITNTETMTITGNLTLANAAQATLGTNTDITVAGNITVNDAASITVNAGTVTLNGTADQTIDLDGQSLYSLTLNNTGGGSADDIIIAAAGQVNLSGDLTVTLGNLDLSTNTETMDVNGSVTFADAAQATMTTDSNVNVGGSVTLGDASTLTFSAGTFTLDGTADQTFSVGAQEFYNLTINNTGGGTSDDIVVAGGGFIVNNDLTITAGNLDLVTNTQLLYAENDVTLASDAQATLRSNSNVFLTGDLTVGALASFSQSASGTMVLNGTGQSITGGATFYNLSKTVSAADTLTFGAGDTLHVTNNLTLNGVSGGNLSLRSSSTGTHWRLNPVGTRTLAYLDVKDSENLAGSVIDCLTSCSDSGNNSFWHFTVAAETTSGGGGRRSGGGGGGGGSVRTVVPTTPSVAKPGTKGMNAAQLRRAERLKIAKEMKERALERAKARLLKNK